MATAADILVVKDNLPETAEAEGWNDTKIGTMVDALGTPSKAIRQYWSATSARTSAFVDISESGSSRSLSDVHKQAVEMLKYWDDRIAQEERDAEEPAQSDGRIAFHKATRV